MIAILHNIRSLHNVGSIFRTADAAGFEKIYLTGITPPPRDRLGNKQPRFTKVSLGAEDYLLWEKVHSAVKLIKQFHKQGYKILAVEQSRQAIPYFQLKARTAKAALVVGNEVKGLPPPILKLADQILEIPMFGKKESLNVAVAFGIVAYHFKVNHV